MTARRQKFSLVLQSDWRRPEMLTNQAFVFRLIQRFALCLSQAICKGGHYDTKAWQFSEEEYQAKNDRSLFVFRHYSNCYSGCCSIWKFICCTERQGVGFCTKATGNSNAKLGPADSDVKKCDGEYISERKCIKGYERCP